MKAYVFLLFFSIAFLSCQSNDGSSSNAESIISYETPIDSIIELDVSINSIDTISLCLPYPNDSFFLVKNDYEFLENYENEPIYYYLNSEFDSLEVKQYTKSDIAYAPTIWTQKFENKITIESTIYEEKGIIYRLYSHCKEKSAFLNAIAPIIEYTELNDSLMYNPEMIWNVDSTIYEPIEQEAGCYYEITKDSLKNYSLEWQCGC